MLRRIIRRAVRHAYLLGVAASSSRRRWSTRRSTSMGDAYPDARGATASCIVERRRPRGGALPRDARSAGSSMLDESRSSARPTVSRRRRVPPARHARLPDRPHQRDRGRARHRRSTSRASTRAMARAARAGRRTRDKAGGGRDARPSSCTASCSTSTARPSSPAARSTRGRRPRVLVAVRADRRRAATVDVVPRPHAVLRGVRRPGRRHRHDHAPTPARADVRRHARTRCPGCSPSTARASSTGEIEPRATRSIARDRRRAPRRDPPQPHRAPTSCTGRCARCSAPHVKQAGSLVAPDRLRFDFSHYEPVTPERARADRGPRQRSEVIADAPVRHYETTKAEAERSARSRSSATSTATSCACSRPGRTRLELCGGTHVHALGDHRPDQDRERGVDRLQPAPHRGGHRHRHDRAPAPRRGRAGRGRRACSASPDRAGRGRQPPARRGQGAARRAARRSASRPREATRPTSRRRPVDGVVVAGVDGTRRATSCATSRSPSATSPASARWCSAARPRAAAPRSSRPSRNDSGLNAGALDRRRREDGAGRRRQERRGRGGRRQGPDRRSTRPSPWRGRRPASRERVTA